MSLGILPGVVYTFEQICRLNDMMLLIGSKSFRLVLKQMRTLDDLTGVGLV